MDAPLDAGPESADRAESPERKDEAANRTGRCLVCWARVLERTRISVPKPGGPVERAPHV